MVNNPELIKQIIDNIKKLSKEDLDKVMEKADEWYNDNIDNTNNVNLEELKKKYEELGKEIEKLEKQKENIRWRADLGENYYIISTSGTIIISREEKDEIDNLRYNTRNYFKTEEEAEMYLANISTYYELMDLANELNNGEEIDWENGNQPKYFFYYDIRNNELIQSAYYSLKFIGVIYCLNINFLNIALKRIGEKRLKKLFEENN